MPFPEGSVFKLDFFPVLHWLLGFLVCYVANTQLRVVMRLCLPIFYALCPRYHHLEPFFLHMEFQPALLSVLLTLSMQALPSFLLHLLGMRRLPLLLLPRGVTLGFLLGPPSCGFLPPCDLLSPLGCLLAAGEGAWRAEKSLLSARLAAVQQRVTSPSGQPV